MGEVRRKQERNQQQIVKEGRSMTDSELSDPRASDLCIMHATKEELQIRMRISHWKPYYCRSCRLGRGGSAELSCMRFTA